MILKQNKSLLTNKKGNYYILTIMQFIKIKIESKKGGTNSNKIEHVTIIKKI